MLYNKLTNDDDDDFSIAMYINFSDMFPETAPDSEDIPDEPLFVTAFSSSHYLEGKLLIENVNLMAKKNFPTSRFFVYDLGLTNGQKKSVCTGLYANF